MLQTAFSLIVTVGRDQLHHPHASGRIEVQILVLITLKKLETHSLVSSLLQKQELIEQC
jgi:hypothetical protein